MDPRFALSHRLRGYLALQQGRVEDALVELALAVDLAQRSTETLAALACGYQRAGDRAGVNRTLKEITSRPYVSPYTLATIDAARGDHDGALSLLHNAYDQGAAAMPYAGVDPRLDPLRTDRRFRSVLNRLGLAD